MFQVDRLLSRLESRTKCNFIGTTMALIGAGLAAAGSIGSAAMGASAANNAAKSQAGAAVYAADLQKKAADDALAFQKEQWNTTQSNQKPWLEAGQGAISQMSNLLQPGGYLATPWTEQFQAPTEVTEQNDPGYQFRINQGTQALQRSAAAMGNLLTGGTAKALTRYSQDYASNEYNNVYNRALTEYQQRYNIFNNNQTNLYNRLAGVSGAGQTSASNLASAGSNTANNVSNILLGSASNIGQQANNAAAARASGYVGSANAWGGALQGVTSNLSNLLFLRGMNGGGSTSSVPGYDPSWTAGA